MERERILVVEDDAEMGRAMSQACDELGFEPVWMRSYTDALKAAELSDYAMAILDRMLPDGDAIDALAGLRASGRIGGILIVSALAHAGHRVEGLERGADDYLPKPFAPEELRARIKAMVRRSAPQGGNDYLVFGKLEIRVKARTVHYDRAHIPLSPKEFELLLYFATHPGVPIGRMELLEKVWNLHFDPQTNVVDVHVGRLRRKLDSACDESFIHTERGAGYLFGPREGG
ncbi:response regulator transcription factor [Mesobacterium pallidum]|uniref:response regulator transcription factor n=1 Tax=Mesobacterium pallidum TaxID=2872037 RepID=UPI001EE260FD|nr:response regulator transcription factor [Mesobacterium pallidum]